MADFAKGIKTLFTGASSGASGTSLAEQARIASERQEAQNTSLARQTQELQVERANDDTAIAGLLKPGRGRRLLQASNRAAALPDRLG